MMGYPVDDRFAGFRQLPRDKQLAAIGYYARLTAGPDDTPPEPVEGGIDPTLEPVLARHSEDERYQWTHRERHRYNSD